MRLRGLNTNQKLILNFLYKLRDTPMMPPDPRLSRVGMEQTLGIITKELSLELKSLTKQGLVLPLVVGAQEFYLLTVDGVREVEKREVTHIEGELSTSRIGIKGEKKQIQ